MANPQITTTPVSTAFSTTNTSTATTGATNWSTQSFTGPSVSSTNAESVDMNTTNIFQSNLTRKVPYSNYSINFDAAGSDRINITGLPDFGGGSLTTSFWIKSGIDASNAYVLMRSGFSFYIFQAGTASNLRYRVQTSALNTINGGAILDNNWHHCVMTFDSTANEFKVFEDGVQVSSTVTTSGSLASGTSTVYLASFANGAPFKDGNFSNLSMFNSALTEEDIIKLYNNGVTQDLNNFRLTPTAWYPMDQSYTYFNGSVLVARDVINGNDGTGVNIIQENLVGNAPGSEASGTGNNLSISNLKGNMNNSTNNSYSVNMADYASGVTNPANSGRSTDTPS